uniref:Dopey N-terminal domain-containing protein n=1 Tax=Ditylenchus dipsaci TaxID=166011 RepID=A0A915CMX1_9BILA
MSSAHQPEASTSSCNAVPVVHNNNGKFRSYASAVEKALKSFENTTEWADLIAALGKLGKVFAANAKSFNEVPNAVTVAKRLSQCLHPALPSSVHLKALDTYKHIFTIYGRTSNLPKNLYLFAIGLFPLMDHCGIKVKSELLGIFEQYFLPMGSDLRHSLPGFIAAVLLGLDEATEFYDRTFRLLENVIDRVGEEAFYACLWQAVHGSSPVRLPALMFLNAKLEKTKQPISEQMYVISGGENTSHMITALCAVAEDSSNTLAQRNLLDFLCSSFQLDSDRISKVDLVQLLRRCLFVVLRRDMSLNRRLYQWLLNRSNDVAFASVPVSGTEDVQDLYFFKNHTLPLIKLAIRDFLKADVVEVSTNQTNTISSATLKYGAKDIQFAEVRVCRLMHYLLDRPELGTLVLNETLVLFLERLCIQDITLNREFHEQCEQVDPSFGNLWDYTTTESQHQVKRAEETRKTFNSLLNSLDAGFLWQYFENLFDQLLEETDSFENLESPERNLADESYCALKERLTLYPLMVAFCLKTVQLDSHGDIRGRYLTSLLQTIMTGIHRKGCDKFSRDIMVALLVICKRLLKELNQNVSVFENAQNNPSEHRTDRSDSTLLEKAEEMSSSSGQKDNCRLEYRKECVEEQKQVEACLGSCFNLLSTICQWYVDGRDRDKTGVLCTISALMRDFADFPLYCFTPLEKCASISDSLRTKNDSNNSHPAWLQALIEVVDADSWLSTPTDMDLMDFDVRARMLDLILYLYVKSTSVLDQHSALFGRIQKGTYYMTENIRNAQKTTTTAGADNIFNKTALVLWTHLAFNAENFTLQTAAFLLLRLHSRRIAESSSEVEDIIVADLTSADKTFCAGRYLQRNSFEAHEQSRYGSLGFIADDLVGTERIELRAIAYAWFVDCSRHNDLYKILQMLLLMLVNPATARVSIQFVQIAARITRDQLPLMPAEANAISMTIESGKQTFHHVCRDIDNRLTGAAPANSVSPWNNFSYIDCASHLPWVNELNKQLLLPSTTFAENPKRLTANSTQPAAVGAKNCHKRTMSDIPQFDEDAESVGSLSLDLSLDQDVYEVMQLMVDAVVEQANSIEGDQNFSKDFRRTELIKTNGRISENGVVERKGVENSLKNETENKPSSASNYEPDEVSIVNFLATSTETNPPTPEHTTTQDLRLIDPAELPNTTCPGDNKQPLLDETHSHMLFYAESPRMVDLGRAEKTFRTIGALLKSGYSLGRHIVNCMISTNTANLKANSSSPCQLILLYYFRSYYLNSPTNYVSLDDLILSWKCKIAALDCFTELLKILNEMVKEVNSRDFVSFVQQIYRFTRTQRAVIALMLTAVPSPPAQKDGWRMPITVDIAEFNNGPQDNQQFKDLIFAYHRSLLNLASSIVILEYNMQLGAKNFSSQSFGFSFERLMENRQLYNSPQNRATIRDSRIMVVELRMFISVILNALKRCPDRHELWLQFLIGTIPYLDRALPTFIVHVVEQICRNIYMCVTNNFDINMQSLSVNSPSIDLPDSSSPSESGHTRTSFYFADFRVFRAPPSLNLDSVKYPANYMIILMESLMSILHFCMIDSASMSMPFLIARSSNNFYPYGGGHQLNGNHQSNTNLSVSTAGAGSNSNSNVSSMMAQPLFTGSGDNAGHHASSPSGSESKAPESWFVAQKVMIKIFPSALAILCDVWSFASKDISYRPTLVGSGDALRSLVKDILNPIAKKHPSVLINAFGTVWISRKKSDITVKTDLNQEPCFIYSSQQISMVELVLSLKILPLNSVIISTSDALKESTSKATPGSIKQSGFSREVALLEMLHECTRQVSVNELRDSWSALNILFSESPISMLPPRASFLQFMILLDFVKKCGTKTIIDDRQISRPILDACQKITDAVNSIVGWQLETTTWLKRTLVVRQDASNQKLSDVSPTMDHKNVATSMASEAGSMRGSTISLAAPSTRLSSIDGMSQFNGSVTQLSMNSSDTKKSATNLRSSLKDTTNKKDPTDSINALFLLGSEDKERLLPTLQAVWNNTLPYLRAKNAKNVRVEKSAMDLLLDPAFFKMDIHALKEWLIVIDNLMTNDKISFKELLARITTGTSTTLSNLITSKEQEYEMRAQSLKRLSFVILSSELDQYSSQLNEIQAPVVHVQVFTCYRLLLIRMRPASFVSIWPSMVTELVQVLTQIEQQLSDATANTLDDLKGSRDDQWMQLYLAACKLLETLCTLPSGHVAQFQMCRWAFVSALSTHTLSDVFVPFAVRINRLLNSKCEELAGSGREMRSASLFNIKTLTSFQELHPFFHTLASQHNSSHTTANDSDYNSCDQQNNHNEGQFRDASLLNGSLPLKTAIARIEASLYVDFADHWQL